MNRGNALWMECTNGNNGELKSGNTADTTLEAVRVKVIEYEEKLKVDSAKKEAVEDFRWRRF